MSVGVKSGSVTPFGSSGGVSPVTNNPYGIIHAPPPTTLPPPPPPRSTSPTPSSFVPPPPTQPPPAPSLLSSIFDDSVRPTSPPPLSIPLPPSDFNPNPMGLANYKVTYDPNLDNNPVKKGRDQIVRWDGDGVGWDEVEDPRKSIGKAGEWERLSKLGRERRSGKSAGRKLERVEYEVSERRLFWRLLVVDC